MKRTAILSAWCGLLVSVGDLPAQPRDVRYQKGNIQVVRNEVNVKEVDRPLVFHMIMRDQINFGQTFADSKHRRMPTTYYHPRGPAGMVFANLDWFRQAPRFYGADARLPASLVGLGPPTGTAPLPTAALVGAWSEPPVAVLGMNAGTVAAYARPLQPFHFYEPSQEVIDLNDRDGDDRFFHHIPDARGRGAAIRVIHGSPRAQLRKQGPRQFYHVMIMEACSGENGEKIFLDLFTKEGIAQCMEHLVPDGILCVHTSHRFVDLPPVLAAIARDLDLHVLVGHDQAPQRARDGDDLDGVHHFTSEWVMLSRSLQVLRRLKAPPDYRGRDPYWMEPRAQGKAWTDQGPNPLHGFLRGHPLTMRYSAVARPVAEVIVPFLPATGRDLVWELSRMPRPVEEALIKLQLALNPDVRKLWP